VTGGETDLQAILASLDVERRAGTYGFVETDPGDPPPDGAVAMIDERRTVSWVVPLPHPQAQFPSAWLTLSTETSPAAVGLTGVLGRALADEGIAVNVLAGLRRDHLLVPVDRADDAMVTLRGLAADGHRDE